MSIADERARVSSVSALDGVLARLQRVRRSGPGWKASCPAHDDREPSLSVSLGDDGRVLLHCHAGCLLSAILLELRLEPADLFEHPVSVSEPKRIAAEYDYTDENGELLFQAVRFVPKAFRQRRPDGRGGWEWSLNGTRRVPFRLRRVIEAVAADKPVYVVEGEKDVGALEQLGLVATTNAGGAGKWRDEYAQPLKGAKVVVIADADPPGRAHADAVARSLVQVGATVKLLDLAADRDDGFDISDYLANATSDGRRSSARRALGAMLKATALYQPAATAPSSEKTNGSGEAPVDAPGESSGGEVERVELRDDIANADRFARDHCERLRHIAAFVPPWHAWDGRRWERDETGAHVEYAKLTADALWLERANDQVDEWRRHANNTRRAGRVRAMVELAASDPRLARRAADFDRDPWLLNVENGTVDLRLGELRAHDPADGITMLAGGAYRPGAAATAWQAFLTRILDGDQELEGFLRRLAGVSAIGAVREHVLVILFGSGANGKTTFVSALQTALGDYAHAAPVSLLVGEQRGGATPELADLRGRRFVTVAETREDGELSVERVKALTGGDLINARHLYGQPFTFRPSHTPWLLTNHKPRIADDGDAIWRRLLLVPFLVTIPEDEQDKGLADRLALEVDGILSWAIQGAREYGQRGLDPPDSVLVATTEYRDTESTFAAWTGERLTLDRDAWTASSDLRADYLTWAKSNDADELSARAIGERLAQRAEVQQAKGTRGVRGWRGVRIRPNGSEQA